MATGYQIPPPKPMSFKGTDMETNWKVFEDEFKDFVTATELNKKDDKIQVATLRSLMGPECRKRLKDLNLTEEQSKKTESILAKLSEEFTPKRNVLYDRHLFFDAHQLEKESIEEYVRRVRKLLEPCKFENMAEQMLRDRIVLGTTDARTRARLFRRKTEDIGLHTCIDELKVSEITNKQLQVVTGQQAASVNYVKKTTGSDDAKKTKKTSGQKAQKPRQQNPRQQYRYKKKADNQGSRPICYRCGRDHAYGNDNCPAMGQRCSACGYPNHFAAVCKRTKFTKKKKSVNEMQTEDGESASEVEDIHGVEVHALQDEASNKLFAQMYIVKKQKNARFQLDSGATCNVINASNLPSSCNIKSTNKVLVMYNKTRIKPLGHCKIRINNPKNNKKYRVECIVVQDGVSNPLLGWKAMQQMNLVTVNMKNVMTEVSPQHEEQEVAATTYQEVTLNQENVLLIKPEKQQWKTEIKPVSIEQLDKEFPENFTGTGKLPGQYNIEVDPNVKPKIHPPRKVPVALKEKLKKELDRLESQDIIAPIKDEATPWVSSMVVVDRPHRTRICLDPKDLNMAIQRCHYPMPTIEDILPELNNAKVFSVMDAKDGFCQVELTPESSKLTTFNTPYGRYRWKRMPQGLKSSPEEYQRRQDQALEGLRGVHPVADDILIVGKGDTTEEAIADHNENMRNLMKRCQEKNLKLNKQKARVGLSEVKFIGHVISDKGLKPDNDKAQAVLDMPKPEDITGVRRFNGFVNYVSKFLPCLSDLCEPLRKLTVKGTAWHWTEQHDKAFHDIKKAVTEHPVLRYYDKDETLTLQTDASETGLGAAIMQKGQPIIAYTSRALTDTETRYAQIEKELLAVVWGLERFHMYTYGRKVTVQSDHKPLEIISRKPLYKAPKRLQSLLLRMQKI